MSVLQDIPGCSKSMNNTALETQLARQIMCCLKPLDNILKCHICFDYFNTCVTTKCCHSFCSLCIRKYMTYRAQCPQCFQEASEPELRCNRQLDEVLLIYGQLNSLLQPFHQSSLESSNLNTSSQLPQSSGVGKLESIQKSLDTSADIVSETPVPTEDANASTSEPSASKTSLKDADCNKVSCPVCSSYISVEKINFHLDQCLTRKERPVHINKRKPLPKVVYHLLSDKEIRKRLKENGLSTLGNRQKLIKRHKTFLLLYNAECDKVNPRPVSDLVKQVEKEESEVKSSDTPKLFQSNKKSNPTVIEEENQRYLKQNKSQFDSLVQEIIKRQGISRPEKDDEAPDNHDNSASFPDSPHSTCDDASYIDWQADSTSPELFTDIDGNQGPSSVVCLEDSDDEEVVVLKSSHDSCTSSNDFTSSRRSRSSQRMLKRKMGTKRS